jgi:hypothetical protein
MGIGVSTFLIAVGAILYFAVSATVSGVSIATVGVVLMAVGGLGLLVSLIVLGTASRDGVAVGGPVQRERIIER